MYFSRLFAVLTALLFSLGLSSAVLADPPAHAGKGGKPGTRSGLIKSNKHIFYQDCVGKETLDISFKLPHDLKAFWEGSADAYLVVAIPNGEDPIIPLAWNVGALPSTKAVDLMPDKDYTAFVLSCSFLNSMEPGDYHFAIILTVEGGDPANLGEWYDAFDGLVATSRIRLTDEPTDEDMDGDGEFDDDDDEDGFDDGDEDDDDGEDGAGS